MGDNMVFVAFIIKQHSVIKHGMLLFVIALHTYMLPIDSFSISKKPPFKYIGQKIILISLDLKSTLKCKVNV